MLKRSLLFAVFLLCALFMLPGLAFADTGAIPPVSSLSPTLVVIALLGLISAYITQAVNTGSILGIKTVPQKVLPYLTIGGSFLGTFVQQLYTAGNVSGTAVFNAFVSGMFMLLAPSAGVALHHHLASPGQNIAKIAAADATATAVKAAIVVLGLGFLMSTQTACGTGQIFGPGSALPSDLQAQENCASAQVLAGNTNVASIVVSCGAQNDATFLDLLGWLTKAFAAKGTITPAKAAALQEDIVVAQVTQAAKAKAAK